MKAVKTENSNAVFTIPPGMDGYDLHCERFFDPGECYPMTKSVWELTPEERKLIAEGQNIRLTVWGEGHPPVAIGVTPEQKLPDENADNDGHCERQALYDESKP